MERSYQSMNFDDQQFKAARVLMNVPMEWIKCDPTTHNLFYDAFADIPVDRADRMTAGEVWETILLHQLEYVQKLNRAYYTDKEGVRYKAVPAEACEGCAFFSTDARGTLPGCWEAKACDAGSHCGVSISWVRCDDEATEEEA